MPKDDLNVDYKGHRERVRKRLLTAGPEAFADYELLELLLFYSIGSCPRFVVQVGSPLSGVGREGQPAGGGPADDGIIAERRNGFQIRRGLLKGGSALI
jgi:hypothetical protein